MKKVQIMNSEHVRRSVQMIESNIVFDAPGLLQLRMWLYRRMFEIGKNVGINHHTGPDYSDRTTFDDKVWISQYVVIETHKHVVRSRVNKKDQPTEINSLTIGRDAWIGAFSVILPVVRRIGEGAIIGAGSVVSRDVGDWEIVGEVPARTIGQRGE